MRPYSYSADMAKNTMSWYVFDYLTTCLGLVSQGLEGQADGLGAVLSGDFTPDFDRLTGPHPSPKRVSGSAPSVNILLTISPCFRICTMEYVSTVPRTPE